MSGIAEILHNQGKAVHGSDITENANVSRLIRLGIPVAIGHHRDNVRGAQAVVVSSAIPDSNPEVIAAREHNIPVVMRGEMLAEVIRLKQAIAVSGSHGKTTTTSLIAAILSNADFDPTIINGGILNTYQTNAKLGNGDWFVVEADESDGAFLKLPSIINVITNIDCEHMGFYKTEANLEDAFRQFIRNLPYYGLGVICADHPRVAKMFCYPSSEAPPIDRRLVTYGVSSPSSNFKAENIRFLEDGTTFDVVVSLGVPFTPSAVPVRIQDVFIPLLGVHNVLNALAAIAVAHELRISPEVYKSALSPFQGVKRRFTVLGKKDGVTFVDDYAHHPTEIGAVLAAIKQTNAKRVIALFQPHRYSRFSSLFQDFLKVLAKADVVIVLPVYAAGEDPMKNCSSEAFVDDLKMHDKMHDNVYFSENKDVLKVVREIATDGDYCIGLGAGSISDIMSNLFTSF